MEQNQNQYQYQYQYPNEMNEQGQVKPKKKKTKVVFIIAMVILGGVMIGCAFQVTSIMAKRLIAINENVVTQEEEEEQTDVAQLTQGTSTVVSDVSQVVEKVMPSVVSITNMSVQQVQNFFGGTREQEVESSGSGIIIGENTEELLIVTNNHVVEGSSTLTVAFVDEESIEGIVKGIDVNKDLAIVAIPKENIPEATKEVITIAQIGDSKQLRVGEPAIAIGNALGYGQSVTAGVISALGRDIGLQGFDNTLIQTDAAINPGNSGGALLNASGEVIGINTIKMSAEAVEGMGYAIPISDVSDIITNLMNRETKIKVPEGQRGQLGIQGVDVTSDNATLYNMPKGVYVSGTVEGGGADEAGVEKGDIIVSIQGVSIQNMQGLQEQLAYYRAGETIEIEIQREKGEQEYERHIVEITLTKNAQ